MWESSNTYAGSMQGSMLCRGVKCSDRNNVFKFGVQVIARSLRWQKIFPE